MRHLYNQGHIHHSLRAPRGDGTWFDVEGEYICTYDRERRITGHCGIQHDVSVKRATAAELATSLERLDLAIVGAGIGIWDVDVPARTVVFGQH